MTNKLLLLISSLILLAGCATTSIQVDPVVGTWNHKIENLPRGDPEGSFTIRKNGDGYEGSISNSQGPTEMSDIEISGSTLEDSNFEAQGYSIQMTGTFEGETFTGKISTQGYEFPMTATRAE